MINVIQTFFYLGRQKIDKKLLYMSYLSAYSAVKIYGNCKLYTDSKTWEALKHYNIPYTDVDTTTLGDLKVKYNSFAIPKLYSFMDQVDPFIHIDFDTFLLKKLDIEPHNEVIYAYDDMSFLKFDGDDLRGAYKPVTFNDIEFFYKSYLGSLISLKNCFSDEFLQSLNFDIIPNFCIFGGHNAELIKKAVQKQLDLYNNNKGVFDENSDMSHIIEQMSFFPFLQEVDKEFRYWQGDIYGMKGFFNRVKRLTKKYPFSIRNENDTIHIETHGRDYYNFPSKLEDLNKFIKEKYHLSFYNKDAYQKLLWMDLGPFIHLGGLKKCELMNKFIIDYFLVKYKNDPQLVKDLRGIRDSSEMEFFEGIYADDNYLYKNKTNLI